MNILKGIKKRIALYKLRKDYAKKKLNAVVCNLQNAKNVGIIYDATNEHEFKTVKNFVIELKKEVPNVQTLGYVDKNDLDGFHLQPKEFGFFCKKEVNWYQKPKEEAIEDFTNTDFDILIDLQLIECIPLRFILAQSKAKFKVGRRPLRVDDFYDLMLEINPYSSMSYFTEQVYIYLNMIK